MMEHANDIRETTTNSTHKCDSYRTSEHDDGDKNMINDHDNEDDEGATKLGESP